MLPPLLKLRIRLDYITSPESDDMTAIAARHKTTHATVSRNTTPYNIRKGNLAKQVRTLRALWHKENKKRLLLTEQEFRLLIWCILAGGHEKVHDLCSEALGSDWGSRHEG